MLENTLKERKNRNLLVAGIICLVGMIGIVGYTYSFFQVKDVDTETITGTVASTSLTLNITKLSPDINSDLVPQLDEYITSAVVGRNNKNCVDDNGNAVCQVYEVKVKNTSSITIKVDGLLELNAGSNPNLKWTLIDGYQDGMTTKPNVTSSIKSYLETTLTANETYTSQQEKTYYLVIWISETNDAQADTGDFTGTITFNLAEEETPASNTLYNVLNIAPNKEILTEFATTSKLDGTLGVYKTEDDIGTSYYFRGNVVNNYVKFGKYAEDVYHYSYLRLDSTNGTTIKCNEYTSTYCDTGCTEIGSAGDDMYWRIIRINGDGTIRLLYTGTQPYSNNDSTTNESNKDIGIMEYNIVGDDNAYLGYMYGQPNSSTYEETHANINNSTIKSMIDTWYSRYINTNYGSKVADAIYCNDRNTYNKGTTGFGTIDTYFKHAYRYRYEGETKLLLPTLTCEREEDKFTKENTVSGVIGNSALTYPVALMTADELVYAGATYNSNSNEDIYLNNSSFRFWTMTPMAFYNGNPFVYTGNKASYGVTYVGEYGLAGIRPVISITSTAITGGTGTASDPFVVQ